MYSCEERIKAVRLYVKLGKRLESRNPNEEQVRFFACLDQTGLRNLLSLIEAEVAQRTMN